MDDDYERESLYYAECNSITPVYSRVFGVGHVMAALPYAFILALVLYGTGWALRRNQGTSRPGTDY